MNIFKTNKSWTNLKAETEAEGASQAKLMSLKEYSDKMGLDLYVKIGGVEAKADLEFLNSIGVKGIIAPMVESEFAVEKFLDACSEYEFTWKTLTIETLTAYENLDEILALAKEGQIQGITIGRGDFAASLGFKGNENTAEVMKKVKEISEESSRAGFYTMIGGRMERESLDTIWVAELPVRGIETRRVAMAFGPTYESTNKSLSEAIRLELEIEKGLLHTSDIYRSRSIKRIEALESRLSNWSD